jgi:LuxR family maltose regulon positive regulatory protein
VADICCADPGSEAPDLEGRAPTSPANAVVRSGILATLRENRDARIVVIDAAPGYGKTTAIAEWVERDPRECLWLTISAEDDDPAVLLGRLLVGFERIGVVQSATNLAPTLSEALPALSIAFERPVVPFILVLDGVDHLDAPAVQTVLRVLARHAADGVQVVLIARGPRALSIGTLTMQHHLVRIGSENLAMGPDEVAELLAGRGVHLDPRDVESLVHETRGWAAVLDIAATILSEDANPRRAADAFTGDDPRVAEFVESAVLEPLSARERDVADAAAVVEQLSGPICDVLLGTDGSAEVLVDLTRRTNLFRPADRTRSSYELHPIVRAVLRRRLAGTEKLRELNERASDAFEQQGDMGRAVEHAQAAHDGNHAAGLVWRAVPGFLASGRAGQFVEWMDYWSDDEIAVDPALCCAAAWRDLGTGDPSDALRWMELARRAPEDLVLPGGTPLRSALALLRATIGCDGLYRMLADANLAIDLGRRDDPLLPVAYTLAGGAHRLLGDVVAARELLEEADELASILTPTVRAHALTQLAILAIDERQFEVAETIAESAYAILEQEGGTDRPNLALVTAVRASLAARHGAAEEVRADAESCARAVRRLEDVMPLYGIEARLLVSAAYAQIGDYRSARMILHEAEYRLGMMPDAGTLPERALLVREQIDSHRVPVGGVAARLTPAEVRVLRLLPTHLSFPEIADALVVSRHTVKTHAVAVYHKLGVSSRRDAVTRARDLGLVE